MMDTTTSNSVKKRITLFVLLISVSLIDTCFMVAEAEAMQQNDKYIWANVYDDLSNEQAGMFYKAEFKKKISIQVNGVSIEQALQTVAQKTGLKLAYSGDWLTQKRVTLNDESISVSDALEAILTGTGFDYMFSRDGHLLINSVKPVLKRAVTQEEVQGTVTDVETGETLPGVNIVIKGTTTGTTTDSDGTFELTVPSLQDTLVFSFVGYQTQEVPLNGRTTIDVALQSEVVTGEEMVVIGYGQQSREEITSAVSSVQSEDFSVASARDAAAMIKGKVAGLSIIEPSGDPTQESEISLRGTISLMGSSEPLVLIDAVPGDLRTVAPEQFESIDVLKDGAAAAIYGSRGSNGVVLISTKKNTLNQTQIQYDGYIDIQTIKAKPDFQNAEEYRQNISGDPQFEDFGSSTDWIDAITRQPVSQSHTLTYMGGTGNTSYTASLNYRNNEGIFLHSDNQNIIARTNLQHSMFDGELQTEINLTLRNRNYWQQSDGESFDGYVYRQALIRNPTDRIFNDEGEYQIRQAFNYDNPLILLNEQGGDVENKEMRLHGTVTWNPFENLSLKFLGSTSRWVQEKRIQRIPRCHLQQEGWHQWFCLDSWRFDG
jgi:TonB-dependent SusC/RagA subfamily outer membrane receptor